MEKQTTVLIVDDNQHMRESLRLLIGEMENTRLVGEAASGEEAISLAAALLPDVILMDINMSPVNGFEATRKIVSRHPSCRIIGLSLHAVPLYARNLLQLGAKGYVTKSASYLEIMEAIRVVADGGEYIDQNIRGTI